MESSILHYRILEKLGQGGMGVVYKAFDTTLERPVALKFLPEALGADDDTKRRLLAEAQAASKLDHPNICPIHSVEETPDGRAFICMAWCEGEPLSRRIERGPVGVEEALGIVAQVGAGLEAAHEHGIIHRDIKPSNIMVSAKGQARITDFGLARIERATRSTRSAAGGTILYMSPEQVRGDRIDRRADVWSLGVVLYELLTGRVPFEGEYDASAMYAILNEKLVPPSTLRPSIGPALDAVVAKALEKDVTKRYASARSMLDDLERIGGRAFPGTPHGRSRLDGMRPGARREFVLSAVASVLLVVLAGIVIREATRGRPEPITVVVLGCEGASADSTDVGVLEDLVETGLERSPFIRAVSKGRVAELKRSLGITSIDEGAALEIARNARAVSLITPSALSDGRTLRVSARVYDPTTGKSVFSDYVQGATSSVGLFDLVDDLCVKLKKGLKVSPRWGSRTSEPALAGLTTSSLPAYRLFSRGEALYLAGDFTRGIPLIERASALDTTFTAPYRRLALWYDYLEDYPRALRYARKLTAHSGGDELSFMKASAIECRVRGEYDEAVALMERCLERRPDDVGMHLDLGYVLYRFEKRYDEAITQLNAVFELDPTNAKGLWVKAYGSLGNAYLYSGQFDQALAAFDESARLAGPGPDAPHSIAVVQRCRGNYDAAIESLQEIIRRYPSFWVSYDELALAYLALGRWRNAAQSFAGYIDRAPRSKRPDGYALLGALHLAQGAYDLAERDADSMLAIDSLSLRAHWLRGRIVLARGGGTARARRELEECVEAIRRGAGPYDAAFHHSLNGWVLLAEGQRAAGLEELAAADRLALPNMRSFHADYIEGCIEAGRIGEAIRMGLDLYAYNDKDASVSFLLARAYEAKGNAVEARRFYGIARGLWAGADPDFRPLRALAAKRL